MSHLSRFEPHYQLTHTHTHTRDVVLHVKLVHFPLCFKTILGEIRDEDDEILPRKDYEVRFQMS